MATLPIKKSESVYDELTRMHDRIVRRAYELFDGKGQTPGRELDDWLQAERELIWRPSVDLQEKDNRFELQMAVPGIEAKDIDVEVTPEEVLVKASLRHDHKEADATVHVCEFASGDLFRSVQLPKKINPDRAKAEFRDGILRVTAEVAQDKPRRIDLNAA